MRKESLKREKSCALRLHGEKKNPVLLPVVLAVSNLCLQPGGKALAHFYFCSSAIISVLFLALFSQLAGLCTSAFYGRAGEARAAAACPQPPAAAPQPTRTPSRPWEGQHSTGEPERVVGKGGHI